MSPKLNASRLAPFLQGVLRIVAASVFLLHGTQKLLRGTWPILNGGELAVLFCFIWLYFFAAGPGPISLDALLGRRR